MESLITSERMQAQSALGLCPGTRLAYLDDKTQRRFRYDDVTRRKSGKLPTPTSKLIARNSSRLTSKCRRHTEADILATSFGSGSSYRGWIRSCTGGKRFISRPGLGAGSALVDFELLGAQWKPDLSTLYIFRKTSTICVNL
jgi:hypothetical protein